ncbi:MAG: adenylate/guanylate cyclase domain-containing protein [Gammaproteobacteria bacterium]|nr:adenylate/guanylate cyclase domain-containing protein [Gammaproteobacteria bacterium]MDH3769249.1 adenylate/guanylate cyclase domain-containing protein [Gammaproteobacteria bacterium]
MADQTELAILFADVVGSTKLYELMGDMKARETVARCLDAMTRATERHNGSVIKTMGDEVMATFPGVNDAVEAAAQMQKFISDEVDAEDVPVAIRVGFHFGPVMEEAGDIFGGAVHIANRMSNQAKAAQIVTSGSSVSLMSPDWQASTRQIDLAPLRGTSDEIALYEVLWQQGDNTRMLPTIDWAENTGVRTQRLRLRYRGQEIVVSEQKPNVSIGRSEDSDLVVKDTLISRLHARIEFTRGKFILVDESTNGTCVLLSSGEEHFVRRDSVQIKGEGAIGLGRVPQADSPQAIHFIYEE